jgi:hypothetical protein
MNSSDEVRLVAISKVPKEDVSQCFTATLTETDPPPLRLFRGPDRGGEYTKKDERLMLDSHSYKLKFIINKAAAHYTCEIFHDEKWFTCDDLSKSSPRIRSTRLPAKSMQSFYLLIYELQPSPSVDIALIEQSNKTKLISHITQQWSMIRQQHIHFCTFQCICCTLADANSTSLLWIVPRAIRLKYPYEHCLTLACRVPLESNLLFRGPGEHKLQHDNASTETLSLQELNQQKFALISEHDHLKISSSPGMLRYVAGRILPPENTHSDIMISSNGFCELCYAEYKHLCDGKV